MLSVPARLAYVVTQDAAVFLDIDNDRYFRLPIGLEATFLAALSGAPRGGDDLDRLIGLGVLEPALDRDRPERRAAVPVAASAVDLDDGSARARLTTTLEVAASLLRARALLRRGFAQTLAALATRPGRAEASRAPETARSASLAFLAARRLVPIRPVCLLDSVALLDFLNRRGLDADLVFGVIPRPFSAHCWLQADGLALNDELDNLVGRAPILVV
ncbi:hypothetical protein PMI01_00621 [Caulobacter sp. AP07]|uniref:lasso peptide biosynthesis B2 protein n=1 Tax=Caulobacter sp. AP07 TaxID=1144304 RepID=UPI000271ED49|nr:lasso peptide biosynthesis B2 protein [Caulobacter sp. AP07]EJL37543.1 hypothetical protein PMI01_00621 [Caulobacter sp. AP07]